MKHFIKAVVAASAMLVTTQASAADFILTQSPNFTLTNVTPTSVSASLKNGFPSGAASFLDNFYFAINFSSALGNGFAGSSIFSLNDINGLDFDNPGGLVIKGYALTQAASDALLNVGGFGNDANAAVLASIAANPLNEVFSQDGTYARIGNQSFVSLNDVPLSADNFYVITFKGAATAGGNYDGNVRASAVPEPATWAMLLVGFGAVGFAMRRRNERQRVAVSFA